MAIEVLPIDLCVVVATEQYSGMDRILLLLGSAFCFWMAVRGVKKGKVELGLATLSRRSHGPVVVWFGIVMNVLIGTMCLLFSIFGRDIWK